MAVSAGQCEALSRAQSKGFPRSAPRLSPAALPRPGHGLCAAPPGRPHLPGPRAVEAGRAWARCVTGKSGVRGAATVQAGSGWDPEKRPRLVVSRARLEGHRSRAALGRRALSSAPRDGVCAGCQAAAGGMRPEVSLAPAGAGPELSGGGWAWLRAALGVEAAPGLRGPGWVLPVTVAITVTGSSPSPGLGTRQTSGSRGLGLAGQEPGLRTGGGEAAA